MPLIAFLCSWTLDAEQLEPYLAWELLPLGIHQFMSCSAPLQLSFASKKGEFCIKENMPASGRDPGFPVPLCMLCFVPP